MARYDSLRKTEFKRKVLAYRNAHPDLSMREVGQRFGITGARVSQIIQEMRDLVVR